MIHPVEKILSIQLATNSIAIVMSSIANRMNSIAKVTNLIAKICNSTIVLLSKDCINVHVYATKDAAFKIILLTSNGTDKRYNINARYRFFIIAILLRYAW